MFAHEFPVSCVCTSTTPHQLQLREVQLCHLFGAVGVGSVLLFTRCCLHSRVERCELALQVVMQIARCVLIQHALPQWHVVEYATDCHEDKVRLQPHDVFEVELV